MTWNSVMGIISSVALICPILTILALRLGKYRTFPVLICYYSSVLVYNLMTEGYIPIDHATMHYWGLANNLMDAPLMLFFLTYFSTSPVFTRRVKWLIAAFLFFEMMVIAVLGLNTEAITVILGPGVGLILALSTYFFIRQTKIAITHRKATGKAVIAASLLFAYGCFGLIYLMYYVFRSTDVEDIFLIYFLVSTFSAMMLSVGIYIEEKRIRKLNELRVTRRELSDIYAGEKKAVPLRRTALLDFDRDQWN